MVEITLDVPETIKEAVKQEEFVSPERLSLRLLASRILTEERIDTLLGERFYKDKIQALPHQHKTAMHVLNNFSHCALLADEVGLGKTIEAGMIIKEYIVRKLVKKVLILVPATLVYQWHEELRSKFGEDFHIPERKEDWAHYDKILASIDTAKTPNNSAEIWKVDWDLLVIDEAHKLKNKQTLNYKFVKGIRRNRCLMLTATPLQNSVIELWNVVDLLNPGFLGTKAQFEKEFVADKDALRVKNNEVLKKKLGRIMIRNLRKDTGINFVKRNVETVLLEFSPEEMKYYNEVLGFIRRRYHDERKRIEEEEKKNKEEVSLSELQEMAGNYKSKGVLSFALIMLTRQIASSRHTGLCALKRFKEDLKDPALIRQLDSIILQGESLHEDKKKDMLVKLVQKQKTKVIVFTTFIETQKELVAELSLQGMSCVPFNGTMNPEEKEEAIAKFKDKAQVLICTDAGSEGRNLQFANVIINYDLPWNPMRVEQRIGRVHRIGQTKDVIIINLAIKDTIEAYILNRLYEKINLFHTTIGEMDLILSQIKTDKSFEKSVFDLIMEGEDKLETIAKEIEDAAKQVEDIKKLDHEIFDGVGKI